MAGQAQGHPVRLARPPNATCWRCCATAPPPTGDDITRETRISQLAERWLDEMRGEDRLTPAARGCGESTGFDGTDTDNPDGLAVGLAIIGCVLKGTDRPPTLAVLNACESYVGAETLLDRTSVVIAMVDEISDAGAKAFALKFYSAIAGGQSLASALTQGQARDRLSDRRGKYA